MTDRTTKGHSGEVLPQSTVSQSIVSPETRETSMPDLITMKSDEDNKLQECCIYNSIFIAWYFQSSNLPSFFTLHVPKTRHLRAAQSNYSKTSTYLDALHQGLVVVSLRHLSPSLGSERCASCSKECTGLMQSGECKGQCSNNSVLFEAVFIEHAW